MLCDQHAFQQSGGIEKLPQFIRRKPETRIHMVEVAPSGHNQRALRRSRWQSSELSLDICMASKAAACKDSIGILLTDAWKLIPAMNLDVACRDTSLRSLE